MQLDHPTNHFILLLIAWIFAAISVMVSIWLSGVDLNGCSEQIGYNCSYIYIDSE